MIWVGALTLGLSMVLLPFEPDSTVKVALPELDEKVRFLAPEFKLVEVSNQREESLVLVELNVSDLMVRAVPRIIPPVFVVPLMIISVLLAETGTTSSSQFVAVVHTLSVVPSQVEVAAEA